MKYCDQFRSSLRSWSTALEQRSPGCSEAVDAEFVDSQALETARGRPHRWASGASTPTMHGSEEHEAGCEEVLADFLGLEEGAVGRPPHPAAASGCLGAR